MDVEWIILADGAEVVNNKLYLLGGGWDRLAVTNGFPAQQPVAVAIAFKVPWLETNQQHTIEIEIDDQDGREIFKVSGQVEVGRPPGLPHGQAQRVQFAIRLELPLDHPGTYVIVTRIEEHEARRVQFDVVAVPSLAQAT